MSVVQLNLKELSEHCLGKQIRTYGRVHKIRPIGKRCFIILRDQIYSIQCVVNKDNNMENFKMYTKIPLESFIQVTGIISQLPPEVNRVESTWYKDFEMNISHIEIISKSAEDLPFTLEDVNEQYNATDRNTVLMNTRLNNRYFDLRAPFNNCIFKLQSGVTRLFREFLSHNDFIEIHSPKLNGTPSEGGAEVFKVDYFGSQVYLAQSPQLYKQMSINSDFDRVYEVGPVFRAENCVSHRHLCEFVGLDIEMALTPGRDYYEIIEIFWGTLCYIFDNLHFICKDQLNYIKSKYKYEELVYPSEPLIVDFKEGVKMLIDAGYEQGELDDLSTANEKKLGELVRSTYGSDLFVLNKYPSKVRPFYTMPANDPNYSHSYDVILRGQEISSGSQRIHDLNMLMSRLSELKLNPELLSDYLKSFKYASRPHGGCGFGLERIVMLYLGLDNIRETSLYPRDPNRVTP